MFLNIKIEFRVKKRLININRNLLDELEIRSFVLEVWEEEVGLFGVRGC